MPQQIDPTIKALASSIGEAETGPSSPAAYTQKGASGEFGRYQFMPDTYKNYAQKYLGDANAQPTVENQNKIIYDFISEKKKAGYNPAQIASMWNAGEGKPDAYKENYKGVNSKGVAYDTPAYVQKVSQLYQQKKGTLPGTDVPSPQLGQPSTFLGDVSKTLGEAGTGISNAVTKGFSGGVLNGVNGLIQGAGAVAGGLSGLVNNALEHTPLVGTVYKGIEGLVGSVAGAAANTNVGKGLISNYQSFAQQHPEIAADLGAAGNIITAIPALKGLGLAKDAVKGGLSTALRGGVDAVAETVGPKLTAGEAADALAKRGTVQKGLLRETQLAPDPRVTELADTIKKAVPGFNPGKSLLYNISQTQKVVTKMAQDLKAEVIKQGANRIYSFKELASRLNGVERPLMISSDATLNNAYNKVIKKALDIAKQKGGKVSNLLDTRQEFDAFIKKQFPNLYSSETLTPMRQAVKDIRGALTDFTAENLPDGVGLKENLLTQHKLITAIENMSEKAVKGQTKELGINALSRFGNRHPVIKGLVKSGTKAAVQGSGIGATMGLLK